MKLIKSAPAILKAIIVLVVFLWFTKPIYAVEYQNCATSSTCVVGEFLYDDYYTPDASASCTLTSRYPDGSSFINASPMAAASNGWYSYNITTGTTEGLYPSQICCTTFLDEYLCLDKSFTVKAEIVAATSSSITAADVWNYPTRSLTSFGTLVADIWNYSTRSLTSFGNLIADIWSHSGRSVSSVATDSATTLANAADIAVIKKVVGENRVLLEQLINKPIVKTYIDDTSLPVLSDKLNQTQTVAQNLYGNVQNLKNRSLALQQKWPLLTDSEIKSELTTLANIFTQDTGQANTSIIASANWLKTSWNNPLLVTLSDQALAAQSRINNLVNDLNLYGNSSARTNAFNTALSHVQKLDELVGSSLASSSDLNLFGFIKKTNERITLLDQHSNTALKLLTDIKKDTKKDQSVAVNELYTNILATNEVPQVSSFFSKTDKNNTLSNKVLGLMAVVESNKLLLAGNTGQMIKTSWLEEGSIIFRTVAINPSQTLTQKVTVKYFLPTEVKKEQIISYDPALTIGYDSIENALFASGEVTLAPQETRTFLVEVEDIWSFRQEEIDSLKNQVNELTSALKGTSYFAQATAIKSDIIVALEKIMLRQSEAVTPENKIRTYRESSLEMNGIEQKITSLSDLLVQSQASGGLMGFVGGVQTISLWGIVLVIVAGFVFLTLYFNALRSDLKLNKQSPKNQNQDLPDAKDTPTVRHYRHRERGSQFGKKIVKIAVITLITSGLSSMGITLGLKAFQARTVALKPPVTTTAVLGTTTDKKLPYKTNIALPESGKIPVRSAPAITSPEISTLNESQEIYVFKLVGNWAQVGPSEKDSELNWWINTQYLEL